MFVPARAVWCLLAVFVGVLIAASPAAEQVVIRGKFLTLKEALASRELEIKPDPELIAKQVVLMTEDGTIVPLLCDDPCRALFLDARLRNCRGEIQSRRFPGVPYVQVVSFKVERGGRMRSPEYYCDVCAITVLYPQTCPCCQGAMELRMRPEPR